jgi:hypothetical protein
MDSGRCPPPVAPLLATPSASRVGNDQRRSVYPMHLTDSGFSSHRPPVVDQPAHSTRSRFHGQWRQT